MTAKDVIKFALAQSQQWLNTLLEDMKATPTAFPTPKGGNHPLWVIGHLAVSEGALTHKFILGEQNPLEKWEPLFGMGSQPMADAGKYPSWDELLNAGRSMREKTLKMLESQSDADFDKPSKAPPEFAATFGTVGQVFQMIASHTLFHVGQVADARRALGKPPKFG